MNGRWIMRRASALVALVLACGCPRATTVRRTVDARREAPTPPHAQETSSNEPVLVKIESFDCAKYDLFPGEAPPKGIIGSEGGIRAWHGGGPNGASWNVEDPASLGATLEALGASRTAGA